MRRELAERQPACGAATTVFIGGGTPSLIGGAALASLLSAIETVPGAEVTVECNPESTTPELVEAVASAGVTRISLGMQSARRHVLAGLGRAYHPGAIEAAVEALSTAGMANFNLDLIYGGAGERDDDWRASLRAALDLGAPHVSAYALTVEAGTPLARHPDRHPDDDVQARRYELAEELLSASGRQWYELSNWALAGHECRHNRACWRQEDYLGVGCAAHSHHAGVRSWNIVHLERYLEAVESGRSPTAGHETLSAEARRRERLELSLRTRDGVEASAFDEDDLAELVAAGLLDVAAGRAVLTVRGRMLANEVALRLRAASPQPA